MGNLYCNQVRSSMTNLCLRETYVNVTENCQSGKSDVYESFTDKIGTLFRSLQKEYGRCIGKVYIDVKDKAKQIGWIFQKRQSYTDVNETYLQETWIELHEREPETTVKEFLKYIG